MSKFYELTEETREHLGRTLHRIRALRDLPQHDVAKGDLGGWVESEQNLDQDGNGWVSGNGRVFGNGCVSGNGWVSGNGRVFGNGCVSGDGWVSGNGCVSGNGRVFGNGCVSGNGWVSGNGRVFGNGCVSGDGCVSGNGCVSGDEWEIKPLHIQGTAHTLCVVSYTQISVGCIVHTPEEWLERYREIGQENGYSDEQIEEYGVLLRCAALWMAGKPWEI